MGLSVVSSKVVSFCVCVRVRIRGFCVFKCGVDTARTVTAERQQQKIIKRRNCDVSLFSQWRTYQTERVRERERKHEHCCIERQKGSERERRPISSVRQASRRLTWPSVWKNDSLSCEYKVVQPDRGWTLFCRCCCCCSCRCLPPLHTLTTAHTRHTLAPTR